MEVESWTIGTIYHERLQAPTSGIDPMQHIHAVAPKRATLHVDFHGCATVVAPNRTPSTAAINRSQTSDTSESYV